ncbi:MAG: glucosamine-6-phosphate deaminase [Provencibacterium sp.]|nr:glucosamine-6-phosphate deaminase [Provencibacterium sp.]
MNLSISRTPEEMGALAAEKVRELIDEAVSKRGEARMMVSTGQSQFEFFEALVKLDIPWDKVEIYHLDEYVGLPITHKASFRKYLRERFIDRVGSRRMHYISGEGDVEKTIAEISASIRERPIDIGVIGIGENGHIAFNDPPADFETTAAYHVVTLDPKCRAQQVGEGWFPSVEEVPKKAISATVHQLFSCHSVVSVVPHAVKAKAVRDTLEAPEVTNLVPATKLREHAAWFLYLDEESAALLKR